MDLYFWLNEEAKLPVLLIVFIVTLLVAYAMSNIAENLKTSESPYGTISLQLANADKAERIRFFVASRKARLRLLKHRAGLFVSFSLSDFNISSLQSVGEKF